jgi:dihydrofolate reductase
MPCFCDITVSVDGYVAGPNPTLEDPLGEGGMELHEWVFGLKAWREPHGLEGGEDNADSRRVEATVARIGAVVMGRRMFSGGDGPWADDPNANGWWGDDPPFHVPVFVLTHHPREPLVLGDTTFTFVNGFDTALELATVAAGDRDVHVAGGAQAVQQALAAGALDELQLHVAPVFLGGGTRLFADGESADVELKDVAGSPAVAHLSYSVSKRA